MDDIEQYMIKYDRYKGSVADIIIYPSIASV